MILIVDFGSQTCHLIARRIRDLGVTAEIINPKDAIPAVNYHKPKGIIFSGGPSSVYGKDALLIDRNIFEMGIPVLGICYGLEVIAHLLGGKVTKGTKKEYGPTKLNISEEGKILRGVGKSLNVWMSHFDQVTIPPKNAKIIASTPTIGIAAFSDEINNLYGIFFHPEIHHTEKGCEVLSNFVFDICQEIPETREIEIEKIVGHIKDIIGEDEAVCALSGGIDSAVAAILTYKAIGRKLTCFYVDTGMMRQDETRQVFETITKNFPLNLKIIKAEDIFLKKLKDVVDPEKKRKIIGETFIRLFEKEGKRLKAKYLIQGTIYPDVIESRGTEHSNKIKTHHNVGGIPSKHGFKIVEPLRLLYKDEVRSIARSLGFPKEMVTRHVFPGPGLAVRIIGEVTRKKLDILRKADAIVVDEIKKAGLYDKIWMAFAVFTGAKTTGVTGDERKYGETIAVRAIESKDTMSADWVRLPYNVLARISERIVTEVFEVVRVVYDITTKPPATMEWE